MRRSAPASRDKLQRSVPAALTRHGRRPMALLVACCARPSQPTTPGVSTEASKTGGGECLSRGHTFWCWRETRSRRAARRAAVAAKAAAACEAGFDSRVATADSGTATGAVAPAATCGNIVLRCIAGGLVGGGGGGACPSSSSRRHGGHGAETGGFRGLVCGQYRGEAGPTNTRPTVKWCCEVFLRL